MDTLHNGIHLNWDACQWVFVVVLISRGWQKKILSDLKRSYQHKPFHFFFSHKLNNMLLLEYAPYFMVTFLQDWNCLIDLVNLNSAFCNTKFRRKLLHLIELKVCHQDLIHTRMIIVRQNILNKIFQRQWLFSTKIVKDKTNCKKQFEFFHSRQIQNRLHEIVVWFHHPHVKICL